MQIVIDIPDYDYRHIKEYYEKNDNVEATYSYIYHGTPLPKGHGRLIDADALKKDDEVTIWKTRDSSRTGKTLKFFSELFVRKIEDAPTIIEADKEK